MAAVSSFYVINNGYDSNYDIMTMDSAPDDLAISTTFTVVEQATLSDTRVKFIYGDTPSGNCMVAKGIAITPDGVVTMGKSGYNAMISATTNNSPESGDTTYGFPLYAKIGDTIYKSVPNEYSTHTFNDAIYTNSYGAMFLMSPVLG